jgi:hypothetical protein
MSVKMCNFVAVMEENDFFSYTISEVLLLMPEQRQRIASKIQHSRMKTAMKQRVMMITYGDNVYILNKDFQSCLLYLHAHIPVET